MTDDSLPSHAPASATVSDGIADAVVIGGGVIGCYIAEYLAQHHARVVLYEREDALLQRASYTNQARVHQGYHYPRSFLTALRSRVNFSRFVDEYRDCIDSSFTKLYAVARQFSKVTAGQFTTFCERIGAPVQAAAPEARRLFDPHLIEDVFEVEEFAFNAALLARRFEERLAHARVEVNLGAHVTRLRPLANGHLQVTADVDGAPRMVEARHVFNCTYSGLNLVLRASGLPLIPLRHELTEMALVRVPAPLSAIGITVMCGPFFSCMPFPARALHTMSHVRYTPHTWWRDDAADAVTPDRGAARPRGALSNFPQMIRDVQRFVPGLGDCEYVESLWETKTVLPSSEVDDSRPILFKRMPDVGNLTNVMGGKIDNIYDVYDELEAMRMAGALA